jgi:hypothetical protein
MLGTISLSQARARTGPRRLERLAAERRQREDAAALANVALGETPAGRRERET